MIPPHILNIFTVKESKVGYDNAGIHLFWHTLREYKIDNKDYDFSGYVFPSFEEYKLIENSAGETEFAEDCNFWKKGDKLEFRTEVKFFNCFFAGQIIFRNITFHKLVFFNNSTFKNYTIFGSCEFKEKVTFRNGKFQDRVEISNVKFNDRSFFQFCIFEYDVDLTLNKFIKSPNLRKAEFRRKVDFNRSFFHDEMLFYPDNFSKSDDVKLVEINKRRIEDEIVIIPNLHFYNIVFTKNIEIHDVDLSHSQFTLCDVTQLRLSECTYVKSTHRLVLYDEVRETDPFEEISKRTSRAEELYRQLKRNFDNAKNWELAGKAYRSQMLMRQKALAQDIRSNFGLTTSIFDWFIYTVYRSLSGFTQSYLRPLFILLLVNLIIFPVYYWRNEFNSYVDGIRKSLNASLPYLKVDIGTLDYNIWWVKSLETLISTILLAFFIIALRKRFK